MPPNNPQQGATQLVQLPTGETAEFPASMSDADIAQVLKAHFPAPAAPTGVPGGQGATPAPAAAGSPVSAPSPSPSAPVQTPPSQPNMPTQGQPAPAASMLGVNLDNINSAQPFGANSPRLNEAAQPFIGAAKGVTGDVAGLFNLLRKAGVPLNQAAIDKMRAYSGSKTTGQTIGKVGEQAGSFLIPSNYANDAIKLAGLSPKAALIARILAQAGLGGAKGAVDTGTLSGAKSGALVGAASQGAGEGLGVAGRKLLQYVMGNKATPEMVQALLHNTNAITPGGVADQATAASHATTATMENAVGNATGTVNMRPSIKVLDDAMANALQDNDAEAYNKLQALRKTIASDITNHPVSGKAIYRGQLPRDQVPSKALQLKRTLGDKISSWDDEARMGNETTRKVQAIGRQAYGTLDKHIDRVAPGTSDMNDQISNLIKVAKSMKGAGISGHDRLIHMLLSGGGGAYASHSPVGTLAAAAGTAALESPTVQIGAGRVLNSNIPPSVIRALWLANKQ